MSLLEIWSEVLPAEYHWKPDCYVGGTPEFVVETAQSATRLFDVIVYYDGVARELNGVTYLPRKYYKATDVVLAINSKPESMGRYNIAWTAWFDKKQDYYSEFNERIVLSPYHQSIFGKDSRIVPLSCHKDKFVGGEKVKNLCLYSSAPDRGGKFLDSIWDEVNQRTGAKGIKTYSKDISEDEMVKLYRSAQFWLHPCQGIELFCISAVKAQVAGCIPVVVPNMALDTTVRYGVRTTIEKFKEDLILAIENPPKVEPVDFGTWDSVTNELFKAVI